MEIKWLEDQSGTMVNDESGIEAIATGYFDQLFHSNVSGSPDQILAGINSVITTDMNNLLLRQYTSEEIFKAIQSMGPTKAADATIISAARLRSIITEFEECSRQRVNFDKSLISFSANTLENVQETIANILQVRITIEPEKYLGLPSQVGRNRIATFKYLADRIKERIDAWNKHYKDTDFMESGLGNYPSLTWKSVWSAKALLATGLQWKVGNGRKISMWNDGWLPMPGNSHITKTDVSISASFVADLFIPNERKWDIEKISNLFDSEEATRILSIPLAADEHEDELVWRYENSEIYNVKNGHKLLQRGIRTIHYTVSDEIKGLYSKLWNLQLPLKIKITIWQFIRNFMPTGLNLYNKHSANSSICRRCSRDVKDGRSTVNRAQPQQVNWKPPADDKVKINFDSAYDPNNKTATSGFLIQGSEGEVLGSGITKHSYVQYSFVGEALAAVAALKFVYESLFRNIELEGDNLTIIKKNQS
ncbi:hypothetical protein K2173_018527 [Erythroxylum novogranatense]|uniref:RNase H type-1 domain-containing protein n=1 Tax=Erythroxylum novogranatense TaxID=1862640 RepID=A0AAV8UAY3_9ROSI|nr:hypothetical protein K2173_018527 [Erythroxylum novogranatense]